MKKNFKAHFIGVGGIGISALARYYMAQGWMVSGSDLAASEITKALEGLGIDFYVGIKGLKNRLPDVVVYSPAVKETNEELREARKLGIKVMSYPEALGELTKKYQTIAIAGAHGKTTTTAMIALMMIGAGLDPTVIVGTKVKEFGDSNFRLGKSKYLVIEACEYDRSFLNYWPQTIVLTNIEMDHMECYQNEGKLIETFKEFVGHLPKNGTLVFCADDKNASKMVASLKSFEPAIINYTISKPDANKLRKIMKVPGEHNVANGLAALSVGRLLEIGDRSILNSLSKYKGVWRRFDEERGAINGKKVMVVSDYGHHPTQIKLTMQAARDKWPEKKIICVFQPHQAWRTKLLFKEFAEVLKKSPLDQILVCDIYQVAGRELETIVKQVSSRKLVEVVDKDSVIYVAQEDVLGYLGAQISGGEVVMIMGAGNIYGLTKEIVNK